MRIGVIGAGAVGGTFAALLARSGHAVEVTARGSHLDAILARGIQVAGAWGDFSASVAASSTLPEAPELAIVATKAHDAEAAIRSNAAALDGIPVLVVQNGISGLASAIELLPASRVSGALAMFAASYLTPGLITITASGPTFVGGGSDDVTREVIAALAPPLDLSAVDDFEGAQWSKLVVNHVNALPAITGLSAQDAIGHRGLRRVLVASMKETVRVARARGIHFASVSGLSDPLLSAFALAPTAIAGVLPQQMARRMGATPNPGSTLQSIRRGQASEIDFLNGAVVREATAAGIRVPVNELLVALVHEVEATGRFTSPDEVIARFEAR